MHINFHLKLRSIVFHGDFTYNINAVHTLDFGISSIYYKLYPGSLDPQGSKSLVVPDHVPTEQALESAAYLGDRINLGTKFSVNLGIRYSYYNYFGPQNIYTYAPGQPWKRTVLLTQRTMDRVKISRLISIRITGYPHAIF